MRYGKGSCVVAVALLAAGCAGAPDAPETAAVELPEAAENGEAAREAEAAGTSTLAQAPAAGAQEGLGLSQEEILAALAANGFPTDAFELQTFPDGREVFTTSYPETAGRQVLWIAIFGEAQEPHTIRMDYYPANASPEEAQTVGRAMDGLVSALFPAWPEAAQWPEVAGAQAWEETRRRGEAEGESQQVAILETQQDGVWLEALGVPRQIASYVITTRDACRASQADGYFEGYSDCR